MSVGLFVYILPAFFLVITVFTAFIWENIMRNAGRLILVPLFYIIGFLVSINPFGAAIATAVLAEEGNGYFFFSQTISLAPGQTATLWLVSPWIVYVVFHTLLGLWLIALAIRRVARVSNS
jgi:hypothetical protein